VSGALRSSADPPPAPSPGRRWGRWLARAALTAGVLAALLLSLPRERLFEAMLRVDVWLWLALLAGFVLGHGVAALKFRLLARAAGVPAGVVETLRAHGAGLLANLWLPSLVGGDVVRAGLVARRHGRPEALGISAAADRLIDTAGLLGLAALGALTAPGALDPRAGRALAATGAILLVALAGALLVLRGVPPDRLPARLARVAERGREALDGLLGRPATALVALALSLAVQAAFVLLNARLGAAVGIAVPFSIWLLAWPLAKLVALAPVSLGGIGMREAALAALLAPFGVEPALAVAQALVWETVMMAGGLVAGAVALALGRAVDADPVRVARDTG